MRGSMQVEAGEDTGWGAVTRRRDRLEIDEVGMEKSKANLCVRQTREGNGFVL